jgi:hypothetical protein
MTTGSRFETRPSANDAPARTPTITIAGKEWPVPQLAPRQNRIVVPALLDVLPKIAQAQARIKGSNEGGSLARLGSHLDTACYDRLTDIAFHALTRAHPDLKREAFDDMPVDTAELYSALSTIAHQAGLLRQTKSAD